MTTIDRSEIGRRFLELHRSKRMLLLPNAWDVSSARIFEEAGFPALGTTSAGIANALGYPDGQRIPAAKMLEVVGRIAQAVSIPVTADMEAGYGSTAEQLAELTRQVIGVGAVGMNLEDASRGESLTDVNLQQDRIRAAIDAAEHTGIPFVLNARTDIFLHSIGPAETRLHRTIERLNAFRQAGAQCLFAPGITAGDTIAQLVRGVAGPLNILATVGTPPVAELEALGVARVSLGSGPMRSTLGLLVRIARALREKGDFSLKTDGAMSYADANRLVRG